MREKKRNVDKIDDMFTIDVDNFSNVLICNRRYQLKTHTLNDSQSNIGDRERSTQCNRFGINETTI